MTDVEKRLFRLEWATTAMAAWLVSAQTGFGSQDAKSIFAIIEGRDDENIPALRSEQRT